MFIYAYIHVWTGFFNAKAVGMWPGASAAAIVVVARSGCVVFGESMYLLLL